MANRYLYSKGHKPFNKGKKGYTNKGTFKKGHKNVAKKGKRPNFHGNSGSFKKGLVPHNKSGRFIQCGVCGKGFSKIIKENNIKDILMARKCKELWNLDNGVTLCEDCHALTDNYKGRGSG